MAPDPNGREQPADPHPNPHGDVSAYISNRTLTDDKSLMTICDAYGDACDYYNSAGGIGEWFPNLTASTYIKNSTGSFQSGTTPGTKYFAINYNVWCDPYVSWALPAHAVKAECDSDERCSGFIMRTDNFRGALCSFGAQPGFTAKFKLS
jgi:hypothetical protein